MPLSRLMGARTRTRFASLVLSLSLLVGLFGGLFGLVEATPAGAAGSASQLAFTTSPTNVAAGSVMTAPVVQLRDSGNNNVLQAGTSVSVAINTGPGSFDPSATTSTTTNSSGQAVFSNLVFDTVGSYTLIATSTGLTSKVSGSFSVTVGPTTQLALSNVPSTVVSGAALGITVTAQDAYGNTETTLSTGSVSLAVNTGPAGGALAGTTSRTLSGGVATFSAASLTTVGSYTVNASYSGLPTVTTGSIQVTTGVAKKLGFVQGPTATTAGSVMSPSPTVQVEDLNGNPVVDTGVSVTLTSTGTLTSGSTKVVSTDVNGTATFSNLTWNTAGTYTVAASASGLTATGNSSSFTIAPTNPVNLVFTTQPTTTSAGSTVSTTVVKIEDSFGNVITSSSDPVTLTPVGPGAFDPSSTPTVNAVNGVATFSNLILDTSGSYTLSASSTDGATGTSHAFTVNPLAATHLAFSQAPANVTAGTVQVPNVQVQAQDQYGNVATTATGTVTLTASPSVTLTSGTRALSSGVATFGSLNIQTAGTYTLTASLSGFTSATSGSFTVSPNVPYQLVFGTQPTNIVAGQLITPSPTVSIEDHFGNLETSDNTDTVTLATVAAGSTATVTAIGGIATFNNVTIDVVGNVTHTLSATSATTPSLKSATSASFTVSPGAPASLAIVQPQLGGQVNTGNSIGTFYLEQYDHYGNNTWGTSGTPLTFSSSSSGGTFSLTQGGPSTTTATFNYPPNNNNPPNNRDLYFYYGDTNVGLPTITVSSPGLVSATQSVEIINVESPGDQTSSTGSAITPLTITGQNSSPDYTFTSWSATGLPDGLSIDPSTGTITGTPTTLGTYSVEVFGYEGTYAYGYTTFNWTIGNTVSVTNPGPQSSAAGTAISDLAISASDSSPSATLTYADDSTLPPGLSIDPNTGIISGTPSTGGSYPVTITVTDNSGFSGTATFTWSVSDAVTVTNPGPQSNGSGTAITPVPITASDSSSGATLSYSDNSTLPPGLSIDPTSGVISGTPTTGGSYPVTITVTDNNSYSGSATFTWTITNTVSVATIANQTGSTGVSITPVTATATDSQTTPPATITWSATGLPAGLSIGASSGTISGTPTTPGTSSVTVTATDNATPANTGSTSFTWTITSALAPTITAIRPSTGPGAGGTRVSITGTHLNGATSVMFGTVAATRIRMNRKGTRLFAYSPAHASGTVDIIVTTPAGSSAPTSADRFTYGGGSITSVSPSSGNSGGGTSVTIKGVDLNGATAVKFGAVAASFTENGDGKVITAVSPAGSPGTVDITITTPGGTTSVTASDQFTYVAPTVTAVAPSHGAIAGGTRVVITGTELTGATSVQFGSVSTTALTVNKDGTRVTVTSPPHSGGTVDVTVTTPSGISATSSADLYTYS